MPQFKNQHFVPRCYFAPFSLDEQALAINLFNIARDRVIPNAPLKNQCSGDWFYGKDLVLERILQRVEGEYSQLLPRVSAGSALSEEDRVILRRFVYLQRSRTDAAARRAASMPAAMVDIACNGEPPEEWTSTFREDVIHAMRGCSDTIHLVNDLKVCLVRNETELDFVASDDPAILTNRFYLQDPRARGMSGGVRNAGALFIMPMTPRTLCLVYDAGAYALPHDAGWVRVRRPEDIAALNEHQYLNCAANIYFSDWESRDAVAQAFHASANRRLGERYRLTTAVMREETEDGATYVAVPKDELPAEGRILLHVQMLMASPSRWPSFLKWRATRQIYSNGTGTGFVRRATISDGDFAGKSYRRIK